MRRLTAAEADTYDLVSPEATRRARLQAVPWLMPGCCGLTLGRLILLRRGFDSPVSPALLAHELVHVEQYARLGIRRFLWRYLREYVVNLKRLRSHRQAYRVISLEVEARTVTALWAQRRQSQTRQTPYPPVPTRHPHN